MENRDHSKSITTARSNRSRIRSSLSPETPEISWVLDILMNEQPTSCIQCHQYTPDTDWLTNVTTGNLNYALQSFSFNMVHRKLRLITTCLIFNQELWHSAIDIFTWKKKYFKISEINYLSFTHIHFTHML